MKPFARYVIGGLSGDDPGNLVRVFLAQLEPDLRDELVKIVDASRNETAWVIERDIDSTLHYWTGRVIGYREDTPGQWSPDHRLALRLARRTDAESLLTWQCGGLGRVVEHMWIGDTGRSEMLAERESPAKDDAETDTCENCQQPITGQVVWAWDDVPLCEECAEPGTFPLPARPTETPT